MNLADVTTAYKLGKTVYRLTKAARPARDKLRQWLFLPTFEAANRAHLRYRALGSFWRPIGERIEFSLQLAREPEGPRISQLALRSLGRRYDAAIFAVEAIREDSDEDSVVFDNTDLVSGIDKNPRVIPLGKIPPYRRYITETGGVIESYSSFRVRITSLTEGGITRAVNLRTLEFAPLNQISAQPHLWKWINSEPFQIGEVVWAKEEIRQRLDDSIFGRLIWSKPVANLMFWMRTWLLRRKFKPRVYAEHSQMRKLARRDQDEGNTPSYAT